MYGFVDNDPVGQIDPLGLAGTPEELDREIEREDVAELRESMGRDASGRYRSDRELVRLAEGIEQNTKRDREKFEENPPYRGSEPIMRSLVPRGKQARPTGLKPTPSLARVCQDANGETLNKELPA